MKKLFKSHLINFLILLVFIALFIKIVWFFISLFLPFSGVSKNKSSIDNSFYYYFVPSTIKINTNNRPTTDAIKIKETSTCDEFVLTAIYDNGKDKKLAAISKGETNYIISIKDKDLIQGYKLIEIGIDNKKEPFALLEKNAKICKVLFKKEKIDYSKYIAKREPKEPSDNNKEFIDVKKVDKNLVDFYTKPKNIKNIWQNISIAPNIQDGILNGYKVLYVKKDSDFNKIGLQKDDIITAVNSKELMQDSDAIEIYKNIKNFEALKLTIKRNNETKDIEYEIK